LETSSCWQMNFSCGRAALLQSKLAARTISHEKAAIKLIAVVMRTVFIFVSIDFYATFIRLCEARSVHQKISPSGIRLS